MKFCVVNMMWSPFLCKKSEAIHLAQLGLIVGCKAGRQNTGKFCKLCKIFNFSLHLTKFSSMNVSQVVFLAKASSKVFLEGQKP